MKPDDVKEPGWYWAILKPSRSCNPQWECVLVFKDTDDEPLSVCCINNEDEYVLDIFAEFVGPIPQPGSPQPMVRSLYHYRVESDGQAVEIGFATYAEMIQFKNEQDESNNLSQPADSPQILESET